MSSDPAQRVLYGSIEAGGTKFLCAVSDGDGRVIAQTRIPTKHPQETLPLVCNFFETTSQQSGRLRSLGIATFGPVELDPSSSSYGQILATTKPGWKGANIVDPLKQKLNVPIVLETDVNGAALGEAASGAAQRLSSFCYLTIGTGIGGAAIVDGNLVRGENHSEFGHFRVPRHPNDLDFSGICPFHGDCLEGLASGPAIAARWKTSAENLAIDHPAWEIEAFYIAAACTNLAYAFSPEHIIIGGGVGERDGLLPKIRSQFAKMVGDYTSSFGKPNNPENLIIAPAAKPTPGLAGGFAIARGLTRRNCTQNNSMRYT